MIEREAKSFVAPKDHHLVDEANERRIQGLSDRYELDFIHKDGSFRTLLVSGGPRVQGAQLGGTLAVLTDITERKRMEEEIRSLSLTDELTKLYNRRGFVTLAEQQLKTAVRMKKKIVLIYMDVDNLKVINDTGGHQAGDKALADISYILRKNFRDSDIIGRLGGDEFAVLAMETTRMRPEILTRRLEEKISIFNASIDTATGFKLSISYGFVLQDPETPILLDEMISRADELMYEKKREKKARAAS
jgi:diguanylate cyclase (GGDEF)-like protein